MRVGAEERKVIESLDAVKALVDPFCERTIPAFLSVLGSALLSLVVSRGVVLRKGLTWEGSLA